MGKGQYSAEAIRRGGEFRTHRRWRWKGTVEPQSPTQRPLCPGRGGFDYLIGKFVYICSINSHFSSPCNYNHRLPADTPECPAYMAGYVLPIAVDILAEKATAFLVTQRLTVYIMAEKAAAFPVADCGTHRWR